MDAIIRQGGAEVPRLAALKVGALTIRTGLSVRTLHCYDEIVRFSSSAGMSSEFAATAPPSGHLPQMRTTPK